MCCLGSSLRGPGSWGFSPELWARGSCRSWAVARQGFSREGLTELVRMARAFRKAAVVLSTRCRRTSACFVRPPASGLVPGVGRRHICCGWCAGQSGGAPGPLSLSRRQPCPGHLGNAPMAMLQSSIPVSERLYLRSADGIRQAEKAAQAGADLSPSSPSLKHNQGPRV